LAGPIRVYLACADDQARQRLSLLLSGSRDIEVAGYAGRGPQAIKTAAELQPDTILVDIDLPGKLGSPATRELSEACPGASIIVLMSSVRDDLIETPSQQRDPVRQHHDDLLTAIRTLRAGEITVFPPW
jgi:DNA-binding NarL/FixJ family response regulator